MDFDGENAVKEFFGNWDNVQRWSKNTRIEWHQDKGRLYIVFFSENNVTKKRIDIKGRRLEVRCDELLIASPSVHGDGNAWTPLETNQISVLSDEGLRSLLAKIDSLPGGEGIMSYEDKQAYIKWLEQPDTVIRQGGRHDAVKILGCSHY